MKNKMTVIKGSSINADNLVIKVTDGDTTVFEQTYYYGYTISWNKSFATKEKPLDTELISDTATKYGVELEDVNYINGKNLFKETMGGK